MVKTQLKEKAAAKGCELQFCREIPKEKQNSLWYGGEVVTILKDGYKFHLYANGDVIGELYRSKGIIGPVSLLFYIKDKSNMGDFGIELAQYISTDEELGVLTDATSDGQLKKDGFIYKLSLTDNNWWEVFITKPDGSYHDFLYELESNKLSDAIIEVIDSIPDLIKEIKED